MKLVISNKVKKDKIKEEKCGEGTNGFVTCGLLNAEC
jgi:hypothetical protein